ncbi:MAG: hypothetical protein ACRDZQ_02220 [Acidimicrobiales bacterium]
MAGQAGRAERSLELLEAAIAAHAAAGRHREAARLVAGTAEALGHLGRHEEAISRLRAALEVLRPGDRTAGMADLSQAMAGALLLAGHREEAAAHLETALFLAEALELPEILCTCLRRKSMLLLFAGRRQEATVLSDGIVAIALAHDLTRELAFAHTLSGEIRAQSDQPGAAEHAVLALELFRRLGDRPGEKLAGANLTLQHLQAGRCEEAERLLDELSRDRPGADSFADRAVMLHVMRGQVPEARAALAGIAAWEHTDEVQYRLAWAYASAAVAIIDSRIPEALELAGTTARESLLAEGLCNEAFRLSWPLAVEAALELDRREEAASLLALVADQPAGLVPPFLRAQAARFRARFRAGAGTGAGDGTRAGAGTGVEARAGAGAGEHAGVEEDFAESEALLERLGYPYWLAFSRLDHAEWLAAQDRPDRAPELAALAAGTFERLGAVPLLRRARSLVAMVPSAS